MPQGNGTEKNKRGEIGRYMPHLCQNLFYHHGHKHIDRVTNIMDNYRRT